jgi:thiosulfate/3-mercaptopyruvate sulfurtransferase
MAMATDLISVHEFATLLDEGRVRPVDCRFDLFDADKGRRDFLAGHVPGAVYADMDRDLAGEIGPDTGRHPLPDPDTFRATLERWGISDDTMVVAYDYCNGSQAVRLWWMLRFWLGHEQVAVLDGGFAGWTASGRAVETAVSAPEKAGYSRTANDAVVATTAEIAETVRSGGTLALVDARDATRFKGESEPVDTVAGHIPGSVNMPLTLNLDAEGNWQSVGALQELWRQAPLNPAEEDVIVMCGSGVTACHHILSAVLAGLPAPRLYVGSWSEWIRDPDRPVGRGESGLNRDQADADS